MKVDKTIVELLLQRKKRRALKTSLVREHREEILELRRMGLSLSDICGYLETKYKISVSPETLKKAVPEVVDRTKKVLRLLSSLSCSELKVVAQEVNRLMEDCSKKVSKLSP